MLCASLHPYQQYTSPICTSAIWQNPSPHTSVLFNCMHIPASIPRPNPQHITVLPVGFPPTSQRPIWCAPLIHSSYSLWGCLTLKVKAVQFSEMWGTTKCHISEDSACSAAPLSQPQNTQNWKSKFFHKSSMIPWVTIWTCSALM
jgi:hypothetical protein